MVVIHIKKSETDQFLYETSCSESNDVMIRDIVNIWNTKLQIQYLVGALEELGKHGIMKHPDKKGIDHIQEMGGETIEKGEYYVEDPLGNRTGNGPGPQLVETFSRVGADALASISANLVLQKQSLNMKTFEEKLSNIRGAVMMAYPMGLPEYDTVKILLETPFDALAGSQGGLDWLDPSTAQLWWAGKEFFRDQCVGDRIGKNEKTKIVAKLQARGVGAPQREPAVSEEERKSMMAHYFKKQEELKKIAEADDDDYLHSSWANPSGLKNSLRGTGNIRPF